MRTLTFNRLIGAGNMGAVYHAELRVPGGFCRPCAVKVIQDGGPDRDHFVARMRDEARLLGMLQDEQILGVSELVMVAGRDAVIMEYVDGVDLSDLLQKTNMPPRALAELGAEMAGTLQRAHSALHPTTGEPLNVIHRDIKPANVMITTRGSVRLLDFGVARAAFSSRESETQGLVLGTLNYFPPEILAGGDPSTSVDIYGLGITLWECATGKEWGAPRVKQDRFEDRVSQRLQGLQDEYGDIVPVLEQALQWDPRLRPDGGVVERALLHAADKSSGQGLRTWAREVVPTILAEKRRNTPTDEWVGLTLQVGAYGEEQAATSYGRVPEHLLDDVELDVPDPGSTFSASKMADSAMGEKVEVEQVPNPPRPAPSPIETRPKPEAKRGPTLSEKKALSGLLALLLGVLCGLILLCVLVILVVVVMLFVLWNGLYAPQRVVTEAPPVSSAVPKPDVARSEMELLRQRTNSYVSKHKKVPSKWSELSDLSDEQLVDPWGSPYQLVVTGQGKTQAFEVLSWGADGKEGGSGENADIRLD